MAKESGQNSSESRGVLIVACGHWQYMRYAAALALSLKMNSKDGVKIAVATDNRDSLNHIGTGYRGLFEHIIDVPDEAVNHSGRKQYQKAKTWIYDLSPFDKTLFLDADSLILPGQDVNKLFEEFEGLDFTIHNHNSFDFGAMQYAHNSHQYTLWADAQQIKDALGLKDQVCTVANSTLIYFNRSKTAKAVFEAAKRYYSMPNSTFINQKEREKKVAGNPKAYHGNYPGFDKAIWQVIEVNGKEIEVMFWANGLPDEFCFTLAMAEVGVQAHKSPYLIQFNDWGALARLKQKDIEANYFCLDMAGNAHDAQAQNAIRLYDRYVSQYAYQTKDRQFNMIPKFKAKRTFASERKLL